jgi:CheY-like chemotaxis protein
MEYSTFSWVNEKHRFVVSSNKGLHLDEYLDMSKRDYIPKTVSQPLQIHLGDPIYGIYSGKYSIPAGYGVVDKKGKYLGAVVTSFVISGLQKKFDEVINVNGVSFVLMKKDGAFIVSSPKTDTDEIKNYLRDHISRTNANKHGVFYNASFFNPRKFGSIYYNNLSNHPYVIFTIYSKRLEKSEMYNVALGHIAISFLLIALIIALLLLFFKSVIKPIIKISDIANKIANDDPNVELTEFYSATEINHLAKSVLSIKEFIAKEKQLRNQLDEANKQLKQLTKSINHDLRNYISGILGLARILHEEEPSKQTQEYSKMIIAQSEEVMSMAQTLLSWDLSSTNVDATMKPEYVNINNLLEELIFLNKDFAHQQEIKVHTNLSGNLPHIKTNKMALSRIFNNIINNAIKYSHGGNIVKVNSNYLPNENKIYVEIADSGIGMTQEQIQMALSGDGLKIDKSDLNKTVDSHGLGIVIVKTLVDLIKAKMTIESQKNRGTSIKLWFDCEKSSDDLGISKDSKNTKQINKETASKTILIADDDLINRTILQRILRNAGYITVGAKDGLEMLQMLDTEHCDMIFSDIQMPVMDGYAAVKSIRDGGHFKNFKEFATIPIVAISSNNDKESKRRALECGVNKYLCKPYNKEQILAEIKRFLG